MEDKGKGVVEGDEGNLEEGPSNMECDKQVLGGDDKDSDEEGLVDDDDDDSDDDDEGDESEEEEDDFEAGSEIPNTFERFEYEALAERKRKALADSQRFVSLYPFVFFLFGYYVSRLNLIM